MTLADSTYDSIHGKQRYHIKFTFVKNIHIKNKLFEYEAMKRNEDIEKNNTFDQC